MKPIVSVTLISLAAIVSILAWHGLFARLTLSEETIPSFSFAYKKHQGNYRQSGHIMDEVYRTLEGEGISTTRGIAIYYDNPRKVAVENLRFLAGCILPEARNGKRETLEGNYLVGTIPDTKAPVIRFPYKGKLSVVLGMLKVYPWLNTWFKAHPKQQGPVMEIYDIPNGEIRYIVTRPMGEAVASFWLADRP